MVLNCTAVVINLFPIQIIGRWQRWVYKASALRIPRSGRIRPNLAVPDFCQYAFLGSADHTVGSGAQRSGCHMQPPLTFGIRSPFSESLAFSGGNSPG
jgi:hypothetical protein